MSEQKRERVGEPTRDKESWRHSARRAAVAFAVLATVATAFVAAPAYAADTITIDSMTFEPEGPDRPAGAVLTTYSGSGGAVEIPDTVTIADVDYAVTGIGLEAFRNKGITAVTIPSTVTLIGDGAFGENQLTSVSIPAGVVEVGQAAFAANELTALSIAPTVTVIGPAAFAGNLLTEIAVPPSVTRLPEWAFRDNRLTSVTLPDTMTSIGEAAFTGNELTSFDIPPLVTDVPTAMLASNRFTSYTFPDTVRTIGDFVLADNPLTHVALGNGVNTLGKSFSEAGQSDGSTVPCLLTSVDFGTSVVVIGLLAFNGCPLTSLALPDTVEEIYPFAFQRTQIASVTLPASVRMMGAAVFWENPHLASVTFLGAVPRLPGGSPLVGPGDDAARVTVTHYWRYGADAVSDGFSSPTWFGSPTRAIATVAFEVNGHGAAVPSQDTVVGSTVTAPVAPTAPGWGFGGWYADADLTSPFDFDAPITRDVTLHAKWSAEAGISVGLAPDEIAADARGFAVRAVVTVDPSAPAPAGNVRFTIDGDVVGDPVPVDGDGAAVLELPGMAAGGYRLGAEFVPADDRWLPDDVEAPLTVATVEDATASIEARPSATEVDQGGAVIFEVEAFDANGDSLGEVTAASTYESSHASDIIVGSTVRFPHASVHSITVEYAGVQQVVDITIVPTPLGGVLAVTGMPFAAGTGLLGVLLCGAGVTVVVVLVQTRRRRVAT